MNIEEIKLINNLDFGSYITSNMYSYFSEAAAVCFENNYFNGNVSLKIEGEKNVIFNLKWEKVSNQIKDMHNDLVYATEQGAYCIAFLIIHKLTDYKIIQQSRKKTGFDFWLGDKKDEYPFINKARLEVSGILKGNEYQINQRIKQKEIQVEQSDFLDLPIFIIVTEFSKPISKIILK